MVKQRRGMRRDIEGMRAVAVLVVVTNHLLGTPAGGFVGVDIFFVISGFLITGLLVREHEQTGRISFREFYARRVRRILPAALVTLLATAITARVVFFESRAVQTYIDAVWAALSAANWHMAATGTDYFQSTLPPSAVQQYWSLSVEEQFYLVWPAIIVLVGLLAWRGRLRAMLVVALSLIVTASFSWGLLQTPAQPTVAYFSTLTRAWELGLGGLLALVAPHLRRLPTAASFVLGWLGLPGIVVATITTNADATFPAPGAIPSVVATLAVIAAGCSDRAAPQPLLTNPIAGYLGRISYSVYLWHWPIIIFSQALLVKGSQEQIALVIVLTLGLSTASFYLVEEPIRQTTWLSDPARLRERVSISQPMRRVYRLALATSCVLAVVLAVLPEEVPEASAQSPIWPTSSLFAPGQVTGQPALGVPNDRVAAAIAKTSWPPLNPSLDQLGASRAEEWKICGNVNQAEEAGCRFGSRSANSDKTVVVIGDSIALSWIPAVRAAFEPSGWRIQGMTFGECPTARIDVVSSSRDQGFTERCAAHQKYALQRVKELKPAVVVTSTTDGVLRRVIGAAGVTDAAGIFQRAETAALRDFAGPGVKVIVLSPPPRRKDLVSCATRFGTPADCLSTVGENWRVMANAEAQAAKDSGAIYIDTLSWTCDQDGRCPGFIGTTPVMADGTHLTNAMSRELGTTLRTAIGLP